MDEQDKTQPDAAGGRQDEGTKEENGGLLVSTARAIGSAIGKVARVAGPGNEPSPETGSALNEKAYKAEYLGSGTFIISKPKRKKTKIRQAQLKNRERGSRR